jgi:hypothetical protein
MKGAGLKDYKNYSPYDIRLNFLLLLTLSRILFEPSA